MRTTQLLAVALLGTALAAPAAMAQGAGNNGNNNNNGNQHVTYLNNIPGLWQAGKLKGLPVYNNQDQQIGSINNILVNRQGQVQAVVIGSGGGIFGGGHTVAVAFDSLQWLKQKPNKNGGGGNGNTTNGAGGNSGAGNGNNQHGPAAALLPGATKASLKNAPQFKVNGG